MKSRTLIARTHALLSLALFLFGTNVCVFAPPASLAATAPARMGTAAPKTAEHPCCARARERAARGAESTPESVAPCCVAVAPVVAAHGATVHPAPVAIVPAMFAPVLQPISLPDIERLALAEDARPPAPPAATPDEGRAPPRL